MKKLFKLSVISLVILLQVSNIMSFSYWSDFADKYVSFVYSDNYHNQNSEEKLDLKNQKNALNGILWLIEKDLEVDKQNKELILYLKQRQLIKKNENLVSAFARWKEEINSSDINLVKSLVITNNFKINKKYIALACSGIAVLLTMRFAKNITDSMLKSLFSSIALSSLSSEVAEDTVSELPEVSAPCTIDIVPEGPEVYELELQGIINEPIEEISEIEPEISSCDEVNEVNNYVVEPKEFEVTDCAIRGPFVAYKPITQPEHIITK